MRTCPKTRRRSSLLPGMMLRPRCDKGWAGARIRMWPPHAGAEDRALITLDTDFADVRTYPSQTQTQRIQAQFSGLGISVTAPAFKGPGKDPASASAANGVVTLRTAMVCIEDQKRDLGD